MTRTALAKRITSNPGILGGKPIIRGTRISVEFVLELLASGASTDDIVREYPHLEDLDVRACLDYAARAHQNEVYVSLARTG